LTGSFPDIIWDGFVNEAVLVQGQLPAIKKICVKNGESKVLNVDMPNDYANVTDDSSQFDCELPKIAAVNLQLQ
jgi:hypothetical protein